MKELIRRLTEAFSPSGSEAAIRELIRSEIEPLAQEIRVDPLGSLVARKGPTVVGRKSRSKAGTAARAKRIMIAAHMDEIGLVATHIDSHGFVRFTTLGGVIPQMLLGGRVRFVNGTRGVMHAEPLERTGDTPGFDKMFIDVGASSDKGHPVKIGDMAGFERSFEDLGERLVAKSMDDRIGCAVVIEAMRALESTPSEVYFVFTTQEEVGTRGAGTAAYGLDPDVGISVDVTGWGDTPGRKGFEMYLGRGPAIKIRDGGMISDPRVVEWMINTAQRAGLPFQREVLTGGTTDARAIQVARAGVPVGCVSIPCRYVHSPSEMVDYSDVQNAVRLLVGMLGEPVPI
jgi:putative aminopeptidase FrvX